MRNLAIILFAYLTIGPLMSNALVVLNVPLHQWPVIVHFSEISVAWRTIWLLAGCAASIAALVLYKKWDAFIVPSALLAFALYSVSARVVWGQFVFGIWIALIALIMAIIVFVRSVRRTRPMASDE